MGSCRFLGLHTLKTDSTKAKTRERQKSERSMVSHLYLHLQALSKCFPKYGLIALFLSICKAVILCQLTMLTSTS